jgi:FSR family fosmidomycin resistance protein-like MFS transporter
VITQSAAFLRDRGYLITTSSHFSVDIMNSGRTLLVAILAVTLGLTNARLGVFLLLYNVGNALSQPFFGLLADRIGTRWLILTGLGWMIVFYSLASVIEPWPALLAITAASLGSGAFHPSGTKNASEASHTLRTQATALFFMSGQLGLFIGPILAGGLIDAYGRIGFIALPMLAALVFFAGVLWLTEQAELPEHLAGKEAAPRVARRRADMFRILVPLPIIIFAINTVSFMVLNFAPKLFTEQGYAAGYVGWAAGIYMLGSAFGGLLGGAMADRVGSKPVILLALAGTILPIWLYIPAGDPWRFPLMLLAGFFGGMPHSILVLMAQSLMPGRRAFASGMTLGFMFFSGAIGSYLLGIVADQVGLALTLQYSALLLVVAFVAALFLPRHSLREGAAQQVLDAK